MKIEIDIKKISYEDLLQMLSPNSESGWGMTVSL